MAKSTPEHENIIDIFDRINTFSYAYEWQKLQNNAIDEIFKLRDLIASHIENKVQSDLFNNPDAKEAAVIFILNELQRAVLDDSCPKAMVFGDVWLNKPENLSNQYLDQMQYKEGKHIFILMKGACYKIKALNTL